MTPKELSRRDFFKTLTLRALTQVSQAAGKGFKELRAGLPDEVRKEIEGARVARIDRLRCLAWEGTNCQICYLVCPLKERALVMRDQKPVIVDPVCDGCGRCVPACRAVNDPPAIVLQ